MKCWDEFVSKHKEEIADKWLKTLKVVHFDARNLYLEAQDLFHYNWAKEHVKGLIDENQRPVKIHLSYAGQTFKTKQRTKEEPLPPLELSFDSLDPYALLENFVITEENKIPLSIINELTFNPLFIHGKLGKTHLLMGIANSAKKRGLNALYVRAQTFTDHFVQAIRVGQMQDFRKIYRKADLLLIDDVHIFANRMATQEEFFHTFNHLHSEKKQLILAANSAPQFLEGIEPRLVSRFEWGITLHLEKPDELATYKILKKWAEIFKLEMNDELTDFLLHSFQNIKSLVKAIQTLVLHSCSTVCAASIVLRELIEEENKNILTPDKIIRAASLFYGIKTTEILGKSQSQECSMPRQIAMYLCRKELNLPYPKIGQIFSRDHSTVMSAIKSVTQKLQNEPEILQSLETITRTF